MSLTSALSVALTGLQVNTALLQASSNNIANAHQAGYTVKTANVTSVSLGADGGGAAISGFTRATNAGLTDSYNLATGNAGYLGTQDQYLKQVQSLLDSTNNNPALSDALSQFQSAWTQYSAAPENLAQQKSLIQAGTNLAAQVRSISSSILKLNRQVITDTTGVVSTLNSTLSQIATINQQIVTAGPSSSSTVNLEDQRDQLINTISGITSVTVVPRPNNQIALYTPGGQLLLDTTAQSFTYNGTTITSATGQDVTNVLTGGSLEAAIKFNYDGSPAAASSAPGEEVIRKLNSQLTQLTKAFTDTTVGSPETFAHAYDNATTGTGELASSFFTVTSTGGVPDPNTFQINASLLDGSATVKQASGSAVTTALTAARSFTSDGLNVTNSTYTEYGTAILSGFQQAASTIDTQNTTATQQQTYYQQSLSNATGVNVDNELVNLTTLQNSYAASAHVISTINQMLQTLTSIL